MKIIKINIKEKEYSNKKKWWEIPDDTYFFPPFSSYSSAPRLGKGKKKKKKYKSPYIPKQVFRPQIPEITH